jgi:hypothetical protein
VFDTTTLAYKRHWGAYGHVPNDDKQAAYDPKAPVQQQFGNPLHRVKIADDGLVYVCDRTLNRIQVFRKDGTFVKEWFFVTSSPTASSLTCSGLAPTLARMPATSLPSSRSRAHASRAMPPVALGIEQNPSGVSEHMSGRTGAAVGDQFPVGSEMVIPSFAS